MHRGVAVPNAQNPGLFPAPRPQSPDLSLWLSAPVYRLTPGQRAKWTELHVKTVDWQECAMLQHETRGGFGPRRVAKHRRRLPSGMALDLCRAHTMAWKRRDSDDTDGPTPGTAA
jgi:hypothetical protein